MAAQDARGGWSRDPTVLFQLQWIKVGSPPAYQEFFQSLIFLPLATLDHAGRPWISLLAGADGRRSFCSAPRGEEESALDISTWLHGGDIARTNLKDGALLGGRRVVAGIGLELLNRRRNKLSGRVESVAIPDARFKGLESEWKLSLEIENALGYVYASFLRASEIEVRISSYSNCPKYINVRTLVPKSISSSPSLLASHELSPTPNDSHCHLPQEAIDLIHEADLVFIATVYSSQSGDEEIDPSRAGANCRGGKPGFVRVEDSPQGSVVYLPDYSGNRRAFLLVMVP